MAEGRYWTSGKIAGLLVFFLAIAAGFAWYGISRRLQKDGVHVQMASPDGRLVARIWCDGSCWRPGGKLLTISPAARNVGLGYVEQVGDYIVIPPPQEGEMPRDDVATGLRPLTGGGPTLHWTGPRALLVSDACPTDADWLQPEPRQYRGVAITFAALPQRCGRRGGI
jgi:hypothetical protein